jgi:large repetitive protein
VGAAHAAFSIRRSESWKVVTMDFEFAAGAGQSDDSDANLSKLSSGVVASQAGGAAALATLVADATRIVPTDGVVVLPAGTDLDSMRVSGSDIVVTLPDGSQIVIVDGAVFVPQIVLGDVQVPAANLAALLIGQEPQPAAGPPQSSGGNFAEAPGNIGDPFGLGDLLPPTELAFGQPRAEEIIPNAIDRNPTTIIVTRDQPSGSTAATSSVNEAGLPARGAEPAGSNQPANSETAAGSIVFAAPDGLGSVTINGVAITAVGQVVTTPLGRLTITSIAPGNYGYTYTLADNTNANANPSDQLFVVVTDSDGDTASATLTISIIDDEPIARDDADSVPAADYTGQTGNVITGAGTTSGAAGVDTQGADGAAVSGIMAGTTGEFSGVGTTINGQYGTLTIAANGSYTYTRNPGTPGGVNDVFYYQLTDGDGDTSTATLTIAIGDSPASVISVPTSGLGTVVDESGLPARGTEPPGSNALAPVETTSGTIIVAAPDGIASVAINGTTVTGPGQTIVTATGTLTITSYNPATGVIGYSFTLTDNTSGDTTTQTLTVTVTDTDGDSDTKSFTITILDDVPTAVNDSATQSTENASVTVNVISNDTPGADGVSLTTGVTIVPGTLSGAGTLVYNNDGSFTYVPAPGEEGTVTFQYTIADGDGDPSTATVTITLLEDSTPSLNISGDSDVAEAGLPARGSESAGSDSTSDSEIATGTLSIATGNDTVASLVINGVNVTNGGSVTGTSGTLVITAVAGGGYSYAYTLTDNTAGDTTTDSFAVTLTDSDGDVVTNSLVIAIVDDVPTALGDTDSLLAGATGPATGNVLTDAAPGDADDSDTGADTLGADGGSVTAITGFGGAGTVGGTTTGQFGTLTLSADGGYSYVRNDTGPINATDTFTYTVTDGDGDTATATLTITLQDAAPVTGENVTVQLDDDALAGGNPGGTGDDPDAANVSGTLAGSGGDGTLTWAFQTTGNPAGFSYVANGTGIDVFQDATKVLAITLDAATGVYGVTQLASIQHAVGGDENNQGLTLNYTVTDVDGDSATGALSIDVDDDTPIAASDTDAVTEDGQTTANGNVLTGVGSDGNAAGADSLGADGPAVGGAVTAIAGGTIGSAFAGAYGALTLNADGTYSYVLDNALPAVQALDDGETRTDIFTYTITDGDGDSTTATLTITVNGTNDAPVVSPATAIVSEEGLAGGNRDTAGSADTTNSAIASGTIVASDVDVEPLAFTLGNPGAVLTADGSAVTWTGAGTGTLVGSVGAVEVIRVTINSSGAYTVKLSQSVDHPGINIEDNVTFSVPVAVSDGTATTNTTLAITIEDDSPIARNDTITTIEGAPTITGNVLTNDSFGADTPGTVTTTGTFNLGHGTLTINANGSYNYTPIASVLSNTTDSFAYTIRDADGDTSTGTLRFTFDGDVNAPTAGTTSASVDDDALSGGIAGGTGDLPDANTDGDNNQATFSGTLPNTFGVDGPGVVTLASMNGLTGIIGTETVTYAWNGGANTLTATGPRGALFNVVVNPSTGAFTLTLLDNVLHVVGSSENDTNVALSYRVTDSDGSIANGTLKITFDDDTPTLGVIQNGTANNNPASVVSVGTLHFSGGADDAGNVGTIALTTKGLMSGGKNIVTSQSGNVLTGYADADGSETVTAGDTAVFTLTLNPTAGTSGQYVFDLTAPLDGVVVNNSIGGSSAFGAGPAQSQILTTSGAANLSVISGWIAGASFNAAQWLNGTNALPAGLTLSSVNGSTGGWGVANNNFTAGEFLRFDFGAPMDDFDAGGPYVAPAVLLPEVSYATFNLVAYGSSDTIQFRIHYTDGTSSSASVNGAQTGYTLTAPAGKFIDWIDLYTPNAGGSGKVNLTAVGVQNTVVDRTLGFTVTLNDGDGDPVTGSFTINVKDGNTPSTPVAPVVLDLDGNGVAFVAASAGVTFDFNGDGVREHTAWVGSGDGLLAIDRNGDGLVNDGSEVVFASNGLTDLQGLSAQYDSNHDGALDAADVDFGKFGVWQDANGNGVTDEGEFQLLTAAGIARIGLVSDGQAYTAANGEVDVLGQATYTKADGATGTVADAVFTTGGAATAPTAANDDQKAVTSSTSGIASALVAASLIATVTINDNGSQDSPALATTDPVLATSDVSIDPVSVDDTAKVQPSGEERIAVGGDEHSSFKAPSTTHFRGEPHVDHHASNDVGGNHANSIIAGLLAQTDLDPAFFASHNVAAEPDTQAMDAILIAQNAARTAPQGVAAVITDALDGSASGGKSVDALLDALTGSDSGHHLAGINSDGGTGFGDASAFAAMAQTMADMAHQQTLVHLETAATTGHA